MTQKPRFKSVDLSPAELRSTIRLATIVAAAYSMYRQMEDHPSGRRLSRAEIFTRSIVLGGMAGAIALTADLALKSVLVAADRSEDINTQITESNKAVAAVNAAIKEMDRSTTSLQKFAIWAGIGTGLLGAVVGGFAGAWAARVVG